MFKHILVATDGSDLSRAAGATGIALARSLKARVTLVHCFRPYHRIVEETLAATLSRLQYEAHCEVLTVQSTEHALELAGAAGLESEAVPVYADPAWGGILDTARDRGCDLIVMGSHGRGGVASALLGSQALKVLGNSSLPVLIVRSGAA
jgi:nucleotide-binding universal stress UspA family protein